MIPDSKVLYLHFYSALLIVLLLLIIAGLMLYFTAGLSDHGGFDNNSSDVSPSLREGENNNELRIIFSQITNKGLKMAFRG
jgi:hypothetical protein